MSTSRLFFIYLVNLETDDGHDLVTKLLHQLRIQRHRIHHGPVHLTVPAPCTVRKEMKRYYKD